MGCPHAISVTCKRCVWDKVARAEAHARRWKALAKRLLEERNDLRYWQMDHDKRSVIVKEGADRAMREALGPELFNRLWGPELERLGSLMDSVIEQSLRTEVYAQNAEQCGAAVASGLMDMAEARGARAGAAVAFGLMAMAEAIRSREYDKECADAGVPGYAYDGAGWPRHPGASASRVTWWQRVR